MKKILGLLFIIGLLISSSIWIASRPVEKSYTICRVKVINAGSVGELEKQVNTFLEYFYDLNDIKTIEYSSSMTWDNTYFRYLTSHSVLIRYYKTIYKEKQ